MIWYIYVAILAQALSRSQEAPQLHLATMGKVHGSLARAGKVKNQTPKVAKAEKKKVLTGRAKKRMTFNRRFVSVVKGGPKRGPNSNQK